MYDAREFNLQAVEGLSETAISLHLGLYRGYVENVNRLHELFFEELRGTGHRPDDSGVFAEALDQSFGGFDAWRKDVLQMAALRGIGWVVAARDRQTNRVFNVWVDEHHFGIPAILANVDWSVVEGRCVTSVG
jgi:Fe-Mn family superoxide dismutase